MEKPVSMIGARAIDRILNNTSHTCSITQVLQKNQFIIIIQPLARTFNFFHWRLFALPFTFQFISLFTRSFTKKSNSLTFVQFTICYTNRSCPSICSLFSPSLTSLNHDGIKVVSATMFLAFFLPTFYLYLRTHCTD